MRLIKLFLLSLGFSISGACSMPAINSITINEITPCNPLYVKVGQQLTITLPTIPSTGFSRVITKQPVFFSLIEASQLNYSTENSQLVGAPSRSSWHYKVLTEGKGDLQFDYQRNWEKHPQSVKQYSCQVIAN